MKNIIGKTAAVFLFLITAGAHSQEENNILLSRDFWTTKPSVEEVKTKIAEGNDPTQMNERAFDPVTMAILADAPTQDIEYLLSLDGIDVNTRTHDGRTYLIWAAMKGNLPVIKSVVAKGADVNIKDSHGMNAINFAANAGVEDKEMYSYLIENGADVQMTNRNGATAILLLMQKSKNPEIIDYFESKGLDLNAKDIEGNGAFNYAAKGGNIEMMDYLLKKGVDHKGKNKVGGNAILLASQGTRGGTPELKTFKYLVSKGIDPDVTNDKGETPLILLSRRNEDLELLKFFVDAGVDPNAADNEGNTALMNAAGGNSLEVVKYLEEKTSNINKLNNEGQTALSNAVQGNSTEVVAFLLEEGARVNMKDKDGNNLVYYWANSGSGGGHGREAGSSLPDEEKLNLLVKSGLSLKEAQPNGNTLLHIAVQQNNMPLTKKAMELELDVNAKNEEGYTPLLLAALNADNEKLLKLLVESGADKSITTDFGESAYDLASENEILRKHRVNVEFLQ